MSRGDPTETKGLNRASTEHWCSTALGQCYKALPNAGVLSTWGPMICLCAKSVRLDKSTSGGWVLKKNFVPIVATIATIVTESFVITSVYSMIFYVL